MRNEHTANLMLANAYFDAAPAPVKCVVADVAGKCGNTDFPLGEQIASTVQAHGVAWAAQFYASKGVALQHFLLLARGAGALQ